MGERILPLSLSLSLARFAALLRPSSDERGWLVILLAEFQLAHVKSGRGREKAAEPSVAVRPLGLPAEGAGHCPFSSPLSLRFPSRLLFFHGGGGGGGGERDHRRSLGKRNTKSFFAGFEGLSLPLPPSSLSPFLFFPFLKSRKESVGEVKEKTRAKNPLRPQSETKPLSPFEMGRLATAHKHLKKALKRQKRFKGRRGRSSHFNETRTMPIGYKTL